MTIAETLLHWYDAHQRKLPWRETKDPYAIWVSETMLQQTRVDTVIPYYHRFMQAFPSVNALADAQEAEVIKLWEGLGYYQRVRNLHAGARQVVESFDGRLPAGVDELRKIRGIGPYTAGAIASIAFNLPVPAMDGNVIRVLSRLHHMEENVGIPSVRRRLETIACAHVPGFRPGDYNQAVMDLGATICVPGTPDCDRCPVRESCGAYQDGDPASLPVLPLRKPQTAKHYHVLLLQTPMGFLMAKRREKLLQGMWVFPMQETADGETAPPTPGRIRELPRSLYLPADRWEKTGDAKHVFTHIIWHMQVYTCQIKTPPAQLPEGWRWVTPEDMSQIAIPTAMKAAKKMAFDAWAACRTD